MSRLQGHHGIFMTAPKPKYEAYKSPYGPNYKVGLNVNGIGLNRAAKFGVTAGSFGVVAGIFVLFFFSDVPKVRTDIMQKVPYIGEHFHREVPPSDNPF